MRPTIKADPEPVAGVPESAGFTPVQLPDMQEQVVVSSLRIVSHGFGITRVIQVCAGIRSRTCSRWGVRRSCGKCHSENRSCTRQQEKGYDKHASDMTLPHSRLLQTTISHLTTKTPTSPPHTNLKSSPVISHFSPPFVANLIFFSFSVTPPAAREGGGPVLATTSDDVQPGQSGDSTTSLPKEHVAPPTKEEEPHKFDGTPLTDEERRGALVLGGILLGGWLLGGFAKPKKVKKSKSGADEAKDKADSKAKELAK